MVAEYDRRGKGLMIVPRVMHGVRMCGEEGVAERKGFLGEARRLERFPESVRIDIVMGSGITSSIKNPMG